MSKDILNNMAYGTQEKISQITLVNLSILIILDELNILADTMETQFGLRYTTHIISCHCHRKGFNAVCNCTVDLEFLRIQPKRTKMQNIQQGIKNEGKRKEA